MKNLLNNQKANVNVAIILCVIMILAIVGVAYVGHIRKLEREDNDKFVNEHGSVYLKECYAYDVEMCEKTLYNEKVDHYFGNDSGWFIPDDSESYTKINTEPSYNMLQEINKLKSRYYSVEYMGGDLIRIYSPEVGKYLYKYVR